MIGTEPHNIETAFFSDNALEVIFGGPLRLECSAQAELAGKLHTELYLANQTADVISPIYGLLALYVCYKGLKDCASGMLQSFYSSGAEEKSRHARTGSLQSRKNR